ncbi:tRNA U34 carboxymethyltransferase [Burkholderiales bacterium]|nr:tRNA U34 carboxymethyltransferase [Burkholderiales bacterium]
MTGAGGRGRGDTDALRQQTIADFGDQWTRYTSNDGFYGSQELFADILNGLLASADFRDRRVLDIGSGTGRIVQMALGAGAEQVTAVEPSDAHDVLVRNVASLPPEMASRVRSLRCAGEELPADVSADIALSIGVLHHIPDPAPVVARVREALAPGGRLLVWLYGKEGNGLYLALVLPLRAVTRRLPHALLSAVVWLLYGGLVAYRQLCRLAPLPLGDYLENALFRMSPDKRRLVIYDQLNPAYAKYYTRAEAISLLERQGFRNVRAASRRGYSWTVVGER